MIVYRIVQSWKRTKDLSGFGAFKAGGRWNSPGTYVLYCSESSSLAYLENIVHFVPQLVPPNLFIMKISLNDTSPIYTIPEKSYPKHWKKPDQLANKKLVDHLLGSHKHLAIRVRSAVNPGEYNLLLDPLFPGFHKLVEVIEIKQISTDPRIRK